VHFLHVVSLNVRRNVSRVVNDQIIFFVILSSGKVLRYQGAELWPADHSRQAGSFAHQHFLNEITTRASEPFSDGRPQSKLLPLMSGAPTRVRRKARPTSSRRNAGRCERGVFDFDVVGDRILADALDDRRDLHEVGPGAGMIIISTFYSWIGKLGVANC
jgi:hypothetical protein